MKYQWKGDNKLCIPGLAKVAPGAVFEMPDECINTGVKFLIAQGLIVKAEDPAPQAPAEEQPVNVEVAGNGADSEKTEAPVEKSPKKNRR